jgi:hypothetical protein
MTYVKIIVDISEILTSMDITDKWYLLDKLWDELKATGKDTDWNSFYDDNNIKDK